MCLSFSRAGSGHTHTPPDAAAVRRGQRQQQQQQQKRLFMQNSNVVADATPHTHAAAAVCSPRTRRQQQRTHRLPRPAWRRGCTRRARPARRARARRRNRGRATLDLSCARCAAFDCARCAIPLLAVLRHWAARRAQPCHPEQVVRTPAAGGSGAMTHSAQWQPQTQNRKCSRTERGGWVTRAGGLRCGGNQVLTTATACPGSGKKGSKSGTATAGWETPLRPTVPKAKLFFFLRVQKLFSFF